jgi:hypothetical protein
MMARSRHLLSLARNKGAALIIVLAFVVLLTGLVVAYFSRTTSDRQLAQSSFNDTDADLLARSALDIVVGDFKQEIVNGSTNLGGAPPSGTPFYSPIPAANVLPMRTGNPSFIPATGSSPPTDPIPNLIRRSVRSDAIRAPGIPSRASAVNSTTDFSANARSVSLARWNSHYLIPLASAPPSPSPSPTSTPTPTPTSTPTPTPPPLSSSLPVASFTPPDWVIVTRNGPLVQTGIGAGSTALNNSVSTNTNYVIGRYAYAVYDEGGLLDVNVAGFPNPTSTPITPPWVTDIGRKSVLAFADLTTIPTTPGNFMSTTAINTIVGFRNYATMQLSNSGLSFPFSGPVGNGAATKFADYFLNPPASPAPSPSPRTGTSRDSLTVAPTLSNGRTDQNFITRTELLNFLRSLSTVPPGIPASDFSVNTLQYLGTFSREKNIATWRAGGTTTNQIESTLGAGRFYMGDLDSIRPPPGNGQPTGVQQEFSLKWKAGSAPATAGFWSYKGPTNSNALDHIPALSGPTGRFAGLLNYAMNKTGDDDYSDLGAQLGTVALLIDQYDSNTGTNASVDPITGSTTTVIAYNAKNHTTVDGDVYVYGMENFDPNRPPWAPIPPTGYVQLDRPFRSVGDVGYAFNRASIRPDNTLDFSSAGSPQAPILDLLTYNSALLRAGIVSLNTRQPAVLAAILKAALPVESPTPTPGATPVIGTNEAMNAANTIVNTTVITPTLSRADIVRLTSAITTAPFGGATDEVKETIPRALAECVQTRTWGLLIDLVAQTGHYPPNAASGPNTTNPLANFVVEGEKHYWLHIAIDRFDGTVVGQQLEEVLE